MMTPIMNLKAKIIDIPDWPQKGVIFRDITPLLADKKAFAAAINKMCKAFNSKQFEYIGAVEARGFIFGAAVAQKLGKGFIPIRKKGKLPYKTESITYDLEYGQSSIEIHRDAIKKGAKVLMIDDLLATGGTIAAACKLVERIGGKIVGIAFLVELSELRGREKLKKYKVKAIITY